MSIIQGNAHTSTGGYQIERSLRFNSADSAYLNRTPASAGNRRTWTWSGWVKRGSLTTGTLFSAGADVDNFNAIYFYLDNIYLQQQTSGSNIFIVQTQQVFRDVSAWYHVVIAFDTNQGTASNRRKIYINGTQVTALTVTTEVPLDANTYFDAAVEHRIGRDRPGATAYYNGYLTEVNFIDGQALTPSDFGETDSATGVWKPKAYSGSYGTNGFYLNFSDNSGTTSTTLGKDSSGNGNNWTPNNFSVTAGSGNDSLVDTPTQYGTDTGAGGEVRGNYCTLNPLDKGSSVTTANGNLEFSGPASWFAIRSTQGISTGKWYWEVTATAVGTQSAVGVANNSATVGGYVGSDANGWSYHSTGQKVTNGSFASYGATWTTNDVIGVALDMDAGTVTFYKNNSSQGQAYSGLTGTIFPTNSSFSGTLTVNFGQRQFAYTAPSGFKALCTTNLPTPTIGATSTTQANKYFNPVLYTGTGSSLSVTGVGFQPDFVWIKGRSGATDHGLYDAVRGVQKQLESNQTGAETTETTGLTALNSDGFTVGALAQLNTNTATYVGWNWKANGTGVTNTAGTRTSTVSANTTSGFSIVTYTGNGTAGATVGHGLGVAPNLVIVKRRGASAGNWTVYSSVLGATKYLYLNTTNAEGTSIVFWNNTAPTSSLITLGDDGYVNANTGTYVAYCFAEVAGYSKFGSYTGNGSADGPFVYCGFRPKWVMVKSATSIRSWLVSDGVRNPYNVTNLYLLPSASGAEATNDLFDFTSNGFKVRASLAGINESSQTFIYAAFAESPFKYSLAR